MQNSDASPVAANVMYITEPRKFLTNHVRISANLQKKDATVTACRLRSTVASPTGILTAIVTYLRTVPAKHEPIYSRISESEYARDCLSALLGHRSAVSGTEVNVAKTKFLRHGLPITENTRKLTKPDAKLRCKSDGAKL